MSNTIAFSPTDPAVIKTAIAASFRKLSPQTQLRNPVMFVVYVGSIITSIFWLRSLVQPSSEPSWFILSISLWLWFTVLFANFAESMAEGRGKAQAEHLKASRRDTMAKKLSRSDDRTKYKTVASTELRIGDLVLVEAGEFMPGDGQVVEGIASVDESAITGESAPVIRESGGDRDSVTGGTRLLSDWLVIRITANPGEMFIDKMINLVEGAKRQKTPNEVALFILLAALTLVFLIVTASLLPFSMFGVKEAGTGEVVTVTVLVSLLVCLAPTTIGGLLSAIGIAGMSRLMKANVIAMSGRAVEAAGDVNVLLLDKTGTITYGNRQAVAFIPAPGVTVMELALAAEQSSLADETPEGRSIVTLAHGEHRIPPSDPAKLQATVIPFTAETRISGIKQAKRQVLKGAVDAIAKYLKTQGAELDPNVKLQAEQIARTGGTPLVVAENDRTLGVIHLKDIVKQNIKIRLAALRRMGIKSIMITGDNPLTAAAIAAEAGVDDFLAEATPEDKLRLIRERQKGGEMVAMVGDGTNDAPALAQSDVAVVMNSGTQAAKEAGNMVDLDSDPTKLIEIVEIGKQLLMTRGALTTFSIANDIAKYFAIIPFAFASTYPMLKGLDVMGLGSPESAILSAVIFNALIIVFLIPLALKGVKYRPVGAEAALRHHTLVYGLGGILVPFVGIKAIDMLLNLIGIA
jgi:K+-transporting ATPase ATPase B chain